VSDIMIAHAAPPAPSTALETPAATPVLSHGGAAALIVPGVFINIVPKTTTQ